MFAKRLAATLTGLAVVGSLAGCASNKPTTPPSFISVFSSEPQNPLVPTNTNENGGGAILDTLFVGLVAYEPNGTPYNAVAESITPNHDSTEFRIKLKDGWKFSNGEPVTADSFIDAWNYGADAKNAQLNADFFSNIQGYDQIGASEEGDSSASPGKDEKKDAAEPGKLSGLVKVNDREFLVKLVNPESTFSTRLGATAYSPLPAVAFKDMKSFGENPIGNGPYMMDGDGSWTHNVNARLKTNPNFSGKNKPKNDGLDFRFYTNLDTAYADVQSGDLDTIRDTVGPHALASYRADFPDSHSQDPMASFQSFVLPYNLEHFHNDEEGRLRRQAISLAVNRKLITQKLFFDTRLPASDFGSPTLGQLPNIKGKEILDYDPEKAKHLWAEANKISPWSGQPIQIAYNADGGHQGWAEAVTNSIRQTLDVPAQGQAYPNFKGLRDDIVHKKVVSGYRSGWQGDYPSIANFLEPQYRTNGSSNDSGYSNPEFDAKLNEAAKQSTPEAAQKVYDEAQAILMRDLPQIPLWYPTASTVWNPKLKHVKSNWKGMPIYTDIIKEG